jgi:uncharacterized protein YjbI with pentapeptide repeats
MAEKRRRSRWQRLPPLTWVLAIAGAAAFVLLWWRVPPLLYAGVRSDDVRVNAITNTRTAFLAGLVGLGALGTFWLNSRVYGITARTFEVTERGHVTDRYSKAIEQLGNDSLDVRLGGIYALEQIAKDSARVEQDQATIAEVLSAFVRVHSDPIYRYRASLRLSAAEKASTLSDEALAGQAKDHVTKVAKLPVDVQAAVTVLGRLPSSETVSRGDLTEATLRHVTLHTDLTGATLVRTDLTAANLADATLVGTDLTSAKLSEADLSGADITRANLSGANLTRAKLHNANFTGANLISADLSEANLTEVGWLTEMDLLTQVDLRRANLTKANLTKAYLTGADFTRANLTGADLTGADLTDARWPEDVPVPEGWKLDTESGRLEKADTGTGPTETN